MEKSWPVFDVLLGEGGEVADVYAPEVEHQQEDVAVLPLPWPEVRVQEGAQLFHGEGLLPRLLCPDLELPEGIAVRELLVQGEVADVPEVPEVDGPAVHLPAHGLLEAVEPDAVDVFQVERLAGEGAGLLQGVQVDLPRAPVLRGDAHVGHPVEGQAGDLLGDLVHVGGGEQQVEPLRRELRESPVLAESEGPGGDPVQLGLEGLVQLLRVLPADDLPELPGVLPGLPVLPADGHVGGDIEPRAEAHGDLDGERPVLQCPACVELQCGLCHSLQPFCNEMRPNAPKCSQVRPPACPARARKIACRNLPKRLAINTL